MQERLQKILSAHGVASRRGAEKLIDEGRVTVNGITAALGMSADAAADTILVDGKPIKKRNKRATYIMMNKPRGYLTTVTDDRGRKTVMDILPDLGTRLYPVGRLDMNTEGLLLLTDDGDFANKIMHPSNEKNKTYHASVSGNIDAGLAVLLKPMEIDGYKISEAEAEILKRHDEENAILRITIHEGRNRQIRKMCEQAGLNVKSLKRVSIGDLRLGTLKRGEWRHLTENEIKKLS